MGTLHYGRRDMAVHFDDADLAHLHAMISAKLRRSERFFVSWVDDVSVGSGRSSIWISPGIPLYFVFAGPTRLDTDLLRRMDELAANVQGLRLDDLPEFVGRHPRSTV